MKHLFLFLILISTSALAEKPVVYVSPAVNARDTIADHILKYNITYTPAVQSNSLFQILKNDKNGVALVTSANLFLENNPSDWLQEFKVIGVMTNGTFLLVKKTGKTLSKDKLLIGGIGKYGYCNTVANYYTKKNNLQYKYIPYNDVALRELDVLGGRLDMSCVPYGVLLDNKSLEIVYDFNKDGFAFITWLIANKDISKEKEKEVLTLIKNAKTPEIYNLFKEKHFDLLLETEKKKDSIFNQQYKFWNNLKESI